MSIQINFSKVNSTVIQKDNSQFLLNINNNKTNPNLIYTYSNKVNSYVYSQISFYRKPSSITPNDIYIDFDSVMIIAFVSTDNNIKDMFGLIIPLKVKTTSDPNSPVNTILNAGQNSNLNIDFNDIIGPNQDFYFTTYSSNPTYNIMIMKNAIEISTQLPIPISPFTSSPFPLNNLQTITISNIPDSDIVMTNSSKPNSKSISSYVSLPSDETSGEQYMECDAIIDNESVEKAEFINLPLNYDTVNRQSEFIQISINFVVFIIAMTLSYIFAPVIYSFIVIRSLYNIDPNSRYARIVATEIDMTLIFTLLFIMFFLIGYYQTIPTSKYNMYLYCFIFVLIYFTSFCSVYLKKYEDDSNFLGIFDFKTAGPYSNVLADAIIDAFKPNKNNQGFYYSFRGNQ